LCQKKAELENHLSGCTSELFKLQDKIQIIRPDKHLF
jgi:hypothetical protein